MDPRAYQLMAGVQEQHWWWAGRRAILNATISAFSRRGAVAHGGTLYDLGCGVGANLPVLQRYGTAIGFDASKDAVRFARERGFTNVEQMDLMHGTAGDRSNTGALALLADVLEHLDDDVRALRLAHDLLAPGGLLVVTVPALPWLWGPADEFNQHRRRYTKATLRAAVGAHFEILRLSYMNSLMFPVVALARFASRLTGWPGVREIDEPPRILNQLLRGLFSLEARLLNWTNLPIGVSLLCVARKPDPREVKPCVT